jgi:transcriptional regulator GlxA family with amidase domain
MSQRITFLALNDCFASNIVGAIDMLWTANTVAAQVGASADAAFEWQIVSPTGAPVRASSRQTIAVDGNLERTAGKVIVVPAFGSPQSDLHIKAVERHAQLLPWLRERYAAGVTLAASCSGSFLLAEAGLLNERPATTSWWLTNAFTTRYPRVHLDVRSMLTECDRLICSGTGMSHVDLMLHLIEKLAGRELARMCAKYAVLDHRRRSQAPYIVLSYVQRFDPLIMKVEKWVKENLRADLNDDAIAAYAAVSVRTLARRFKESTGDSPRSFVQKVRLEAGKALLESTHLRVDAILERIGYMDASAFRRLFKRHTGLSPSEYRRQFGIEAR